MAIGFMLLKMANVLSKEALFYTTIVPLLPFLGHLDFYCIYPRSNCFHPTALPDKLLNSLGPRFLGPIAILRIWSFCLFYVMAELWGSVVISVLFWGFANRCVLNQPFSSENIRGRLRRFGLLGTSIPQQYQLCAPQSFKGISLNYFQYLFQKEE